MGGRNSSYSKALAALEFDCPSKKFSRSSICEARQKVSWAFFRKLLHQIIKVVDEKSPQEHLWRGRPVYGVDGTKLNVPHELKACKYKASNGRCFYPQALLTTLVRLKSNLPCHFVLSRRTSETHCVPELLRHVAANGIVVYDRLYCSGPVLKDHIQAGVDGVFRLKTGGTFKKITDFIASGLTEQIVEIKKRDFQIKLRLVRYTIAGKKYYLATTLLDSKCYSIKDLKDLYHSRWGIEEAYKFIKQEIGVEEFHAKTPNGVKQEVAVALLLTAIVRVVSGGGNVSHKKSSGVASKLLVDSIPSLWGCSGLVRKTIATKICSITKKHTHQSPLGRSFQRRSRKVISRWQRNIAHEWRKKKSLERKALQP